MRKVTPEQAKELAREVLDSTEPECDVRLAHLDISAKPPSLETTLNVEASLEMAVSYQREDRIICMSRYVITAEPDSSEDTSEDASDGWHATVELHGVWTLTHSQALEKSHAQAFGLAVGAMALHPYARAHVQSVVTSAGYPAFTLSVMTSLMEAGEDGLINLDQVEFVD